MRPLVIDDNFKSQLNDLISYAQENRVTPEMLQGMCDGTVPIAGDDPKRVIETQFGYRIVFSIEGHPQADKSVIWLRHMSVSVDNATKLPNVVACEEIASLLGFPSLDECGISTETFNGGTAVNVIAVIGREK